MGNGINVSGINNNLDVEILSKSSCCAIDLLCVYSDKSISSFAPIALCEQRSPLLGLILTTLQGVQPHIFILNTGYQLGMQLLCQVNYIIMCHYM